MYQRVFDEFFDCLQDSEKEAAVRRRLEEYSSNGRSTWNVSQRRQVPAKQENQQELIDWYKNELLQATRKNMQFEAEMREVKKEFENKLASMEKTYQERISALEEELSHYQRKRATVGKKRTVVALGELS